jgi:choloylglycine hydrolase
MKIRKTTLTLLTLACLLLAPRIAKPCSSFVLQTEEGLYFATNFDNSFRPGLLFINGRGVRKKGIEPGTTGRTAEWTAKYGSVTICTAGIQLPWSGMNEAGLVLSTMIVSGTRAPAADERPPLLSPLWMQYMLDTCATVEELVAACAEVRIDNVTDHYLVCDRSGATLVLEFLGGEMVCHGAEEALLPVLTNTPYLDCLRSYESGMAQDPGELNTLHRFLRLAERIETFEESEDPVGYAFDSLASVATSGTRWSQVYDIDRGVMSYRSDRNAAIRSIDLRRIDFATAPAVQMLDAHAELEGDLLAHFQPYDHDLSRIQLLRAVEHYRGGQFTIEEIDRMLEHFESFARPEESD